MSSNQNQNQKQAKANRAAATHTGGMRTEAKKTRVVFKNILDTPFNIPWPEVTSENNAIVLDVLCDMLKPIREYHNARPKKDSLTTPKVKKTKKTLADDSQSKPNPALATTNHDSISPESNSQPTSISTPPPAILNSIIIGINSVTKSLERSIQDLASYPPPSAVFLCKGDLAPSHLYSHLGPMVAMLPGVKLFPFLRASEKRLSEALGMQAVGALAIKTEGGTKEAEDLIMILERLVDPINVSWLPKVKPPAAATTASAKEAATEKNVTATTKSETKDSVLESTLAATEAIALSSSIPVEDHEKPSTVSGTSSSSERWIATNIKSVKTTMPIIVKTPKPAASGDNKGQNNKGDKSGNNSNNNKNSGGNGKPQQQQQQQQQQRQQKKQQPNQGKGNKHPSDNPNQGRDKDKKPRTL
ncbi:hypothetical protein BGZ80_003948 [Entomortierella chlamydospora]|uniref:Uncharacterized protein n=1 Tax=Entomortierella chlamydospora TaxID=101097 RepID=A0A9P6N0D2_9FUNG|nr:hypothetical protein BGZ79_008020 [Entomortierella chlamydospora]KAG0020577.1 hypothetical protein BGZ80_003948 [Entomortierella chlamydospora]